MGVTAAAPEALVLGRIVGGALVAVGIFFWAPRTYEASPGRLGVVAAVLVYDVIAAIVLALAGIGEGMIGFALWPAVAAHFVLAAWCLCRSSAARTDRG